MLPKAHGILPIQDLRKAVAEGIISSPTNSPIPQENLQPASLDLRLGDTAHRLRCGFLPQNGGVLDWLEDLAMESLPLEQGAVLEGNRPYLVPLLEELDLPPGVRARTNPRSSTGRLKPVHPGHHRPVQSVRQRGPRVPGPDVPGDHLPVLRLPGRDGSLPEPDPAAPGRPCPAAKATAGCPEMTDGMRVWSIRNSSP